jgi:hypothetical protein
MNMPNIFLYNIIFNFAQISTSDTKIAQIVAEEAIIDHVQF